MTFMHGNRNIDTARLIAQEPRQGPVQQVGDDDPHGGFHSLVPLLGAGEPTGVMMHLFGFLALAIFIHLTSIQSDVQDLQRYNVSGSCSP